MEALFAMLLAGVLVVACTLITLARMNIRRWLGYAGFVDVAFTILLIALFHSTFSGMLTAAFAGIVMSLTLQVMRKTVGVERLTIRRVSIRKGLVQFYWKEYRPNELTWLGFKAAQSAAPFKKEQVA